MNSVQTFIQKFIQILFSVQSEQAFLFAKYFFIFFGLVFLLSLVANYLLRKRASKILRKLLAGSLGQLRIASFTGIIFTFLRLENVRYFSMLIFLIAIIVWIIAIIVYMAKLKFIVYPKKIVQIEKNKEAEKYLPGKKKR